MKVDVRNHSGMTGIEQIAEDLYKFAVEQLGFDKPCRIVFESQGDRAVDIFSPTAHYKPHTQTVTVYVDHRHPKDILRSMAHELIHHAQYCAGQFDQSVNTSPGYAQTNQHMREMEKDAYFRGNITLFRDFEDNYKKGKNVMEEGKHAKPDFLDLDKDGDKKEPMKKAAKDAEEMEEEKSVVKEEQVEEMDQALEEEVEQPLDDWYQETLFNTLMDKFIKK
jgi:hypothetical protein